MTPVMLPVAYLFRCLPCWLEPTIAYRCQIVKLTGVKPNKMAFGLCSVYGIICDFFQRSDRGKGVFNIITSFFGGVL